MKTRKLDMDIDFIGGEGKLTKQEELALEEYFRNKKQQRKRPISTRKREKVQK